jgi:hypothetical protein
MSEERPAELEGLLAALRRPVAPNPKLRGRVLAGAREHGVPRRGIPYRPRLFLAVGAVAAALAVVALLPPRSKPDAARLIPFVVTAPDVERVAIVGDFNDWDPQATPLARLSGNAWGVMVKLPPGRYRYSFVLDGSRWIADPGAPRAADDDFDFHSSVTTILARGL